MSISIFKQRIIFSKNIILKIFCELICREWLQWQVAGRQKIIIKSNIGTIYWFDAVRVVFNLPYKRHHKGKKKSDLMSDNHADREPFFRGSVQTLDVHLWFCWCCVWIILKTAMHKRTTNFGAADDEQRWNVMRSREEVLLLVDNRYWQAPSTEWLLSLSTLGYLSN